MLRASAVLKAESGALCGTSDVTPRMAAAISSSPSWTKGRRRDQHHQQPVQLSVASQVHTPVGWGVDKITQETPSGERPFLGFFVFSFLDRVCTTFIREDSTVWGRGLVGNLDLQKAENVNTTAHLTQCANKISPPSCHLPYFSRPAT